MTIGEEGFFGPGDPHDSCNPGYPGSTWPQQSGQDFTNNHKSEAIDFAVRPPASCLGCSAALMLSCWVAYRGGKHYLLRPSYSLCSDSCTISGTSHCPESAVCFYYGSQQLACEA